jgi:succinate dehydrogenase / fumarate reductase cytochrome b subunit
MNASTRPAAGSFRSPVSSGRLRRFWDSSVGKKVVMAATGIGGIGFVVIHMVGNLQMFLPTGAGQAMHDYAAGLRKLGPLLWVARLGLVAMVLLHVTAAWQLTLRNRAARPVAYGRREGQVTTWGARTMRIGGVILVLFVIFHILDMTLGVGHPEFVHLDPYNNLRIGFQRWWAVAFYVVAIVFLGLHLFHGAWSSWRTLGLRRPSERPLHRSVAIALAVALTLGFLAVPVAGALGLFAPQSVNIEHATAAPGAP